MQLDKRLLRACAIPACISVAALAFGGIVGMASKADPSSAPVAHAAVGRWENAQPDNPSELQARTDVEAPAAAEPAAAMPPQKPLKSQPAASEADSESNTVPPAESPPPEPAPSPTPAPPPPSLFEANTLVAFYGTPLAPGLGVLGTFPPDEMALRLIERASVYDGLNGDRGTIATMDLIYSIVQDQPTSNGLFLNYLSDDRVNEYIGLAERYDLQLVLDLQIGRGNVAEEVRKIERFLLHPRVHVAIDPEYAVGPYGYPILTPGVISGHDINAVQSYLHELVAARNLPPKMFVIHQFMDKTIIEGEVTQSSDKVDLVLNMDAYGAKHEKDKKYRQFASRPYAEKRSYNIFLKQDEPISTEYEVLQLDPVPDMVMYQ